MFSPYSFSRPLSVAPKRCQAIRSRHFIWRGFTRMRFTRDSPKQQGAPALPEGREPWCHPCHQAVGDKGRTPARRGHQPCSTGSGAVGLLPAGLSLPIQPDFPDLILGALQVISGASSGPHPHQDASYLKVPSQPAEKTGSTFIARMNRAHGLMCASVLMSHSRLLSAWPPCIL